jgi:HK97 family phage prohead protease
MTDLLIPAPSGMPLEFRSAQVLDVNFPERIIRLIAMPYGQPAGVMKDGRMVMEWFEPGSFDGVERRASRIKVNRDHDLSKTVGRAVALYPNRAEGLIADLRISGRDGKVPLGDETLELANDGVLDASVGWVPMPGGENWLEQRSKRQITKAWLGHIALVPDPAYQGAQVLEVRRDDESRHEATSTTPLKDEIIAMLRERGHLPAGMV